MKYQMQKNNGRYFLALLLSSFMVLAVVTFVNKESHAQTDEVDASEPTTGSILFLPYVFSGPNLAPENFVSSRPASNGAGQFSWQLTWDNSGVPSGTTYLITESNNPDMEPVLNTYTATGNSYTVTQSPSTSNTYYYTVQVNSDQALVSEPIKVVGAYRDDFDLPTTWQIRRQDFDDTNNVLSYQADNLKMHVRGRWDYFVTSPLAEAPEPPYRISTLVRFDGAGNLNAYGIIFGGDWNGGECPSIFPPTRATAADNSEYDVLPAGVRAPSNDGPNVVDNCLNNYYRLHLLWKDGGPTMLGRFKKIDYHDSNNEGRGQITALNGAELKVSSGSANDWNEWSLEVYPDGTILLFSGEERIRTFQTDPQYINRPYFGLYASSNEYPGADPLWHYFSVEPIEEMSTAE